MNYHPQVVLGQVFPQAAHHYVPVTYVHQRPVHHQAEASASDSATAASTSNSTATGTPVMLTAAQTAPTSVAHHHIVYTPATQALMYHPILKSFNAVVGAINVPLMIDIISYLAAVTILITYVAAASQGHVPWFPCMITATGTDYPENIFFRIGLISSVFYWVLMIQLEYFWLKAQAESLAGVISVNYTNNIIAFVGFFFFGITIATIDQGYTPQQIHGGCAVLFFILLFVYMVRNLAVIRNIRKLKPDVVSQASFNSKVTLCKVWYLVGASLIMYALKYKWGLPVAEWIGTYSIIFYMRSSASDLKGFILNINDEKYDVKTQLARNYQAQKAEEATQQTTVLSYPTTQDSLQAVTPKLLNANNTQFMSIQRPYFTTQQMNYSY